MIIGIDASRNRSGGSIAHLLGILSYLDVKKHSIESIHIWSYSTLLTSLPNFHWLHKHNPEALEGNLLVQLWWQATKLSSQAKQLDCDILFTSDASSLCRFKPMVTLSQDLVSYEPGLLKQYDWSYEKIRNYLILYLQNACFRHSSGVIFLTEYAKQKILRSCGNISRTAIIPHGVDDDFHQLANVPNCNKYVSGSEVKCIYVSPVFKYKNHVNVTRAIANLRKNGINVVISFIGGSGDTEDELKSELICLDPEGTFVTRHGQVPYSTLPDLLTESDLFIFASECEAFGITLLEGMCASLPIACSNKSSLPETLQDGGIYFDPKNVDSIANAIELLIKNPIICSEKTVRAKELSKHYTWSRCSDSTFRFINDVYESVNEMRVVDEL